jgi:hypothetical protein
MFGLIFVSDRLYRYTVGTLSDLGVHIKTFLLVSTMHVECFGLTFTEFGSVSRLFA